ncbi:MAG TPA: hypothetical protein VNX01_16450 [Bacteroidia bacterium]|jgi:hypothetical protein|nr:hypothetical protein [Bacteroidia bacterium]
MENNTRKQASDATQNYLKEIYAGYNDDYNRDLIKILEDLRSSQGSYYDWFTPKIYIYPLSEEHKDMLKKHNVIDDDYEYSTIEAVFFFHEDVILELNKKMLDWWKSQYQAGNIKKENYIEEICNIIHNDFELPLDTQEEIELFASGSHPEYSEGEHFRKYLLI